MLLSWFDATEAKDFGESLAQFYMARVASDESGTTKKAAKKHKEVLEKLFQQMARFKREHKLNIYKTAQLGNAFKWTLKDAGYDPAYVDQLTTELMKAR